MKSPQAWPPPMGYVQYLHRPMCSDRDVFLGFVDAQWGAPNDIRWNSSATSKQTAAIFGQMVPSDKAPLPYPLPRAIVG